MMSMFRSVLGKHYRIPGYFLALDIGCGVGTASLALAQRFTWVVAIDPYLPNLILAQKLLDEQGVHGVILVQAYAQSVPLCDHCVDYAVAENVIDHLLDVSPAFHEIRRILRPSGCFCGDSRNRFDLVFPEVHVGLRWVGFLPRKLQSWYVQRRRGLSYAGTSLLSLPEIQRYARSAFGRSARVVFPLASSYGRSPKWDVWVQRIERVPILRTLLLLVFPSHLLVAQANPNVESSIASDSPCREA
ncbi:MAG: class I SAM-dependent methyltransferase [Gemmatimonadota bacterium]